VSENKTNTDRTRGEQCHFLASNGVQCQAVNKHGNEPSSVIKGGWRGERFVDHLRADCVFEKG
jgi:hypothetical protein